MKLSHFNSWMPVLTLSVLLAATAPCVAQTPAATTQPATPTPPTPATAIPAGQIMMNFHDASLQTVLTFLAQAGHLTVINEANVTGTVNVINRHPLTIDQALSVLDSLLKDRGFAAVRMGRTLKIMPLDTAKTATIPVYTGNDPAAIPDTDQMITQVIPVRSADAAQLKTDLAPLVPSYANLTANASTNTLVLTDTGANVRRLVTIIRAMDTTVSQVSRVRVFQLKYADATTAAKLISDIFKPNPNEAQSNSRASRFARFFRGRRGQNNAAQEQGGQHEPQITAAADSRTNTVVVSAPADMMDVIADVLAQLDANPAENQEVFIYHLKNAQAEDVQNVINALFNPNGSTGITSSATNNTGFTGLGTSGFGGSSGGLGGSGLSSMLNSTSRNRNTAASARLPTRTSGRSSGGSSQSAADLANQVYAVADTDTNSVLIMTASANMVRVKKIIEQLDRPVPQVFIQVLIAEITHEDNKDLGVEFSVLDLPNTQSFLSSNFGIAGDVATGGQGLIYKLVESKVTAALRALQHVGKLNVLSRPYILTSDNQTASIIVGQTVPFITDSRVTDDGQTINTIQYQNVGIILNVTPHINPQGLVTLDVAPEISSQSDTTVPITAGVNAPVFNMRAAETRVAIRDGQTIVIGGLMQNQKNITVDKVPLLGDIPLVGALFRHNTTDKVKTELLIFLTPHVAKVPEDLKKLSDDQTNSLLVSPKRPGKGK